MGRGGRNASINAVATVLMEASAFKIRRKRNKGPPVLGNQQHAANEGEVSENDANASEEEEEEEAFAGTELQVDQDNFIMAEDLALGLAEGTQEYAKRIDADVRTWALYLGCERDMVDDYFDNPPVRKCT